MTAPASPRLAPLGDSLAAAAAELRRLGAMGEALQDALSPLLLASPAGTAEAQGLDRMVQHAQDLAAFVERCGRACPAAWRIDPAEAAGGLKLAELADRLGGTPVSGAPALVESGEPELW